MSGGGKLEVINTRERAVSQDVNRLQAFLQYDRAEIFRRLYDNRRVNVFGGGVEEQGSYVDTNAMDAAPVGTPLKADLFEGLVGLPQTGTLNLLVSPGAVYLDDPDGQAGSSDPNPPNPDDSRFKLVVDPGVSTVGTLVFAAGGGGTRIDVLECQRMTVVVETDNRDIFDPSTGLFSAVSVTKVTEGRLNYRIRQGTPGGGMPANVQGWLPLMVASVPSSATTVDTMTFWDVRPLVKDRISAGYDTQRALATLEGGNQILGDDFTDPSKTLLYGFSTSQIGMYRAGGFLSRVDAQSEDNQEPTYTPVSQALWYLYAVFPNSLPRWVKYSGSAPIVPGTSLGIPVISSTPPVISTGLATGVSINAPTSTGLSVSGPGALLACGFCNTTPAPAAILQVNRFVHLSGAGFIGLVSPSATTGTTDTYDLSPGIHFPVTAKKVFVAFLCTLTGSGDAFHFSDTVQILKPGTNSLLFRLPGNVLGGDLSSGTASLEVVKEIPTLPFSDVYFSNGTLKVVMDWAQSLGTKTDGKLAVFGWEL